MGLSVKHGPLVSLSSVLALVKDSGPVCYRYPLLRWQRSGAEGRVPKDGPC